MSNTTTMSQHRRMARGQDEKFPVYTIQQAQDSAPLGIATSSTTHALLATLNIPQDFNPDRFMIKR